MYRVLIVDDERMAREATSELLSMIGDIEMELPKAGSAMEAEKYFIAKRVDIVVLDINMPQISGLEFYDRIKEKWPYCKAIFLTAYSEFDYVYRVHEHAKYVLKAEDEQKLLDAFYTTVEEIENEILLSQARETQLSYQQLEQVYMGSDYLREMLAGGIDLEQLTEEDFCNMGLSLLPGEDVFPVALRYSGTYDKDFKTKQKVLEVMRQLVITCFLEQNRGGACYYNQNLVYLLLQPLIKEDQEKQGNLVGRLEGYASIFQEAFRRNTGCSTSILLAGKGMSFTEAIAAFEAFRIGLSNMEEDVIQRTDDVPEEDFLEFVQVSEERRQILHRLVQDFGYYLDINHSEGALAALRQITGEMQEIRSKHDLLAMEVYNLISTKLLGMILRWNLQEQIAFRISTLDLCNVSAHSDWKHAFRYLESVMENMYALRQTTVIRQKEVIIQKIKHYIKENLNGDTSLCTLADYVNLSQEYLLRIFKKEEGVTILKYINDKKIAEAKRFLRQEQLQVKEVAEQLGFSSSGYFIRFFREKTGMTPHQYQEARD